METHELLKTVLGWFVAAGGIMAACIGYLFRQVVGLSKKVGNMEAAIEDYKKDIAEYKACPVDNCYFRLLRRQRAATQSITTNSSNPLPS